MRLALPSILAAALLAGCATAPQPSDKLQVAASIYPLAFFATEVGGDAVHVTQLVPTGAEPHDYEPTPQQAVDLEQARIIVMNGGSVDASIGHAAQALAQTPVIVNAIDNLTQQGVDTSDPHVWLNPVHAQTIVGTLVTSFGQQDFANSSTYLANGQRLNAQLAKLDDEYRTALASCTGSILTAHDAFGHLAKQYNLNIIPIAGLSPEEEPSPKDVITIIEAAKAAGVRTVFFETLASPKLAETIAQEIGAKTDVLNPIEGLLPEQEALGADYLSLMRDNLSRIQNALTCK